MNLKKGLIALLAAAGLAAGLYLVFGPKGGSTTDRGPGPTEKETLRHLAQRRATP